MQTRTLRCLRAAAVVAVAVPAAVAAPAGAEPAPARCALSAAEVDPLADRAGTLAQFEGLPSHCLKSIVRRCTTAAGEAMLDTGSAAACSFGYEALLRKDFGGDFQALLAWWRSGPVASANR